MKIRNGFVSNSSSSSFIIIFDKKPKSPEEVKNYLFGSDKEEIECYGVKASPDKISNRVFDDIKNKEIARINDLIEEFVNMIYHLIVPFDIDKDKSVLKSGYITDDLIDILEEKNQIYEANMKNRDLDYQKRISELFQLENIEVEKIARRMADDFINEHKEWWYTIVSYHDDSDSFESLLEHGDIFRNIQYIKISHH